MEFNLVPVERGPIEQDRTHDHWPQWKVDQAERTVRESFDETDLMDDIDLTCAVLAREGLALELGLLLVKRAEATIQRRTNREIYGPSTVELFGGTSQALSNLSARKG